METTEATVVVVQCQHYWPLPSHSTNDLYHAKCSKCGMEKDFPAGNCLRSQFPTQRKRPSIADFMKHFEQLGMKG